MNNNQKQIVKKCPSLSTLLGILFIGLKLGGVIDWSWVWVLAPFWIGACVSIIVLLITLAISLVAALAVSKIDND